jgi:hypothetical protein
MIYDTAKKLTKELTIFGFWILSITFGLVPFGTGRGRTTAATNRGREGTSERC